MYMYNVHFTLHNRIHSIPSVPVVDLFQKIRQQVKCYLMTANNMEPSELQEVIVMSLYTYMYNKYIYMYNVVQLTLLVIHVHVRLVVSLVYLHLCDYLCIIIQYL